VTLDASEYQSSRGTMSLGHLADADGDGAWNRLEWVSVLDYYQVTTPSMTEAAIYVEWALDPTLPTQVDIGLDLPDGDGTNWDYSYLPQGTVTFESAQGLPIEIRILDPPGREDVPVTIGEPVQIPLGAELLITLAPGADHDWFYTWSAPGNMIDGSAEKTERFRLMRSATIKPVRRPVSNQSFTSPPGETGYTWEWSGVGAFGHLVTSGSGSAMVQVPEGAALKVRAYKLKEAPGGGGTSTAGDIKTYCQRWELYDTYYAGNYYVFGSSPAFGNFTYGYSITPIFGSVYAPHGWFTHRATCNEGGAAYIAATSPAWNDYIAPVLLESARVPAPAPEDPTIYLIETDVIPEPGYQFSGAEWDENGPPNRYTAEIGSRSVKCTVIQLGSLIITVNCEEGCKPVEAGMVFADPAWRYYGPNDLANVYASSQIYHRFVRWSGQGTVFLPGFPDVPDLDNPVNAEGCKEADIYILFDSDPQKFPDIRFLTAIFGHCLHGGLPNGTEGQRNLNLPNPEGYLKGDVRMPNPLPEGLGRYPAERDEGGDDWGSHHYIHQKLIDAGATWHALHPDHPILFNDISKQGGGYFGRASHQNGLDVDVAYLFTNNAYDRNRSQALIELFAGDAACQYIGVDRGMITIPEGSGPIRHWDGHDGHFHIRYFDPDGMPPEN
jgi:hypothetical protein